MSNRFRIPLAFIVLISLSIVLDRTYVTTTPVYAADPGFSVTGANTAPTITSSNTVSVPENQTSVIKVEATDDKDREGFGLTFSLSGGADQALFNINSINGLLTFISKPDFENPGDVGADNNYDVQVAVTDSDGLTGEQDMVVTVLDSLDVTWRLENVTFNTGATASGTFDYDASQNTYSNFNITVSNSPGNGTNTYGFPNPRSSGSANFMNAVAELKPDLTGVKEIAFLFAAPLTDAGGTVDIQIVSLSHQGNCRDANCRGPAGPIDFVQTGRVTTVQSPPTITSADNASVPENQMSAIDVQATDDIDSEGSGLTFSPSGGADQSLFSIDTDTGVITFINEPDFENPADAGSDNNYDIQVTVTDSDGLTAVQDIVITVTDLVCAAFPLNVATETDLNTAFNCYKEVPAGSYEINVTNSVTLTALPVVISNLNGAALTINGGGNTIDGANSYTPIQVLASTVTIDNITLQNGSGSSGGAVHIASGTDVTITNTIIQSSTANVGGGIWNAGTANVINSTLAGSSSNSGGGIRNNGTLSVSNSLFTGNSTSRSGEGGGLSNYGTAHVRNSTVSGNSAAFGAALYTRGSLTVSNSTLSGNPARALAGGIYVFWTGNATVYNSTLSNNSANVGGNILNNGGTFNARNSIIANSSRGSNCYGSIGDTNSLTDDGSCGSITQSNSINLANLADNGCVTPHTTPTGPACGQTHALNTGSAAIGAGDNNLCTADPVNGVDQRGFARGAVCDIGAFEVNSAPTITSTDNTSVAENQTSAIDVQATDDRDAEGSGLTFSLSDGADQGLFSIEANTGVVTFISAPDYEAPGDAGSDNNYNIQVTVTDSGSLTATQEITISVTDVVENSAPTITSINSASVAENQTSAIDVQATDDSDSEGAGLTFSLSDGADQGLFNIDANTGVVTFISAPDYEAPGDAGSDNNYNIQVTVTDSGSLTATQEITISVTDVIEQVNTPPVVNAGVDQTALLPAGVNLSGSVTDDGLPGPFTMQWSKVSGPGDVVFSDATAQTTTASFSAAGTYVLRLTANDGALTGFDEVMVTINEESPRPNDVIIFLPLVRNN